MTTEANDNWLLPASVHAAKGVVLRRHPEARCLYIGDGEWAVYETLRSEATLGFGVSQALAWQEACRRVELPEAA